MTQQQVEQLYAEVQRGGHAYARNLAAAESAIQKGQFNVAKVLRAAAHTQRMLAMQAARLLSQDVDATSLFGTILAELDNGPGNEGNSATTPVSVSVSAAQLAQFETVRARLRDLLHVAIASLGENRDILESDVAQFLWGCYGCGYIAEGDRPDFCPVCGALAVEFEWFGPFYSKTPEHLGQLSPDEIVANLAAIPDRVAYTIVNVSDTRLRAKPSPEEWCAKEIIGHMIETDILFTERVQVILEAQSITEPPRPAPPWKLQEGKGYEELSSEELIERMRQIRGNSLELLRSLEPQQWSRQGLLQGAANSVLDLGSWLANHDEGHLAQVQELCQA